MYLRKYYSDLIFQNKTGNWLNFQMFRLTVRSSKESMSVEICDLLVDQF